MQIVLKTLQTDSGDQPGSSCLSPKQKIKGDVGSWAQMRALQLRAVHRPGMVGDLSGLLCGRRRCCPPTPHALHPKCTPLPCSLFLAPRPPLTALQPDPSCHLSQDAVLTGGHACVLCVSPAWRSSRQALRVRGMGCAPKSLGKPREHASGAGRTKPRPPPPNTPCKTRKERSPAGAGGREPACLRTP